MAPRIRALALAAGVAAAACVTAVAIGTSPANATTQICDAFGSVSVSGGAYIVQNNNWGDSTTQCINVTDDGFSIASASHNKPQNGAPGAYPSIYAGCHYANCSTGSNLPMQTTDTRFGTISTSVSMSYPSNNSVYDAAYDIWFDPTPRTDGQNTGAEVMIWLNHTGSVQPVGSVVGTVSLAGGTWTVWEGNIGWNVISYVRTSATTSLSFRVADFYNDAVARGYGQRSWYLTSVQAGFEPWVDGTGLTVNSFSYALGTSPTTPPASPTPTATTGGGTSCHVSYVNQSEWAGGFVADVTIKNTGSSTVNGWALDFSFPSDQRVTGFWNTQLTQNGAAVHAVNLSYNAVIAPGASTTLGFQGVFSASDPVPTSFSLNGTHCS